MSHCSTDLTAAQSFEDPDNRTRAARQTNGRPAGRLDSRQRAVSCMTCRACSIRQIVGKIIGPNAASTRCRSEVQSYEQMPCRGWNTRCDVIAVWIRSGTSYVEFVASGIGGIFTCGCRSWTISCVAGGPPSDGAKRRGMSERPVLFSETLLRVTQAASAQKESFHQTHCASTAVGPFNKHPRASHK